MKAPKDLAKELQATTIGCRLSFSMLGTSKRMTKDQIERVAKLFEARPERVKGRQDILDRRQEKFAAVTHIKNQIRAFWIDSTLPYTEDGIRLLKKESLEAFGTQMTAFKTTFEKAVQELQDSFTQLKETAREELGELYCESNYPSSVLDSFAVDWSFPAIEPDERLMKLSPETYAKEKAKIAASFKEAVQLAQQAFTEEFAKLVTHLAEKLQPDPDGKKKILHETTVSNLLDFFTKFEKLQIGGNDDLEKLVTQAKELMSGTSAKELKDLPILKTEIANGMAQIAEQLKPIVQPKVRRKIITPSQQQQPIQQAIPA